MSTVRLRRLTADFMKLQDYVRKHPRVRLIQVEGDPPERYQLEFRINSLRMVGRELQQVQSHLVEIALPLNYPRTPPQCRMLSPVFHPNIAPHAICVGDHWGAGESLESIVIRIGEMLAYQSYNVKSPLNGEAARWVELNKHLIPLDPVSLLPEDEQRSAVSAQPFNGSVAPATHPQTWPSEDSEIRTNGHIPAPPGPAINTASSSIGATTPTPSQISVTCSACGTSYLVSSDFVGRAVRCKCGQTFQCAADATTSPQVQ